MRGSVLETESYQEREGTASCRERMLLPVTEPRALVEVSPGLPVAASPSCQVQDFLMSPLIT